MSNSSASNVEPSWTVLGNATCLPPDSPEAVWPYCPSEAAAVLFFVLFFGTMVANIGFAIRYRTAFLWVLIMGASWEFGGFVVRALGTRFQQSLAMYAVQLILILLAPLWINAFVYMFFARLVYYFDPSRKVGFIPATKLGPTLIGLDVATFLVQLVGVVMLTSTDLDTMSTGKHVYMLGIGIQQTLIVAFLGFVIRFHLRVRKSMAPRTTHYNPSLILIYVSLLLITTRIIFRFVEYSQGFTAAVARTESYQYIFDAVPMFNATLIWAIWHPGRVLVDRDGLFPTRAEKKARKQVQKAQKKTDKAEKKAWKNDKKAWKSISKSVSSGGSTPSRGYSPQPLVHEPERNLATYYGAEYAEHGAVYPHVAQRSN
jgi:hypothetical protein